MARSTAALIPVCRATGWQVRRREIGAQGLLLIAAQGNHVECGANSLPSHVIGLRARMLKRCVGSDDSDRHRHPEGELEVEEFACGLVGNNLSVLRLALLLNTKDNDSVRAPTLYDELSRQWGLQGARDPGDMLNYRRMLLSFRRGRSNHLIADAFVNETSNNMNMDGQAKLPLCRARFASNG